MPSEQTPGRVEVYGAYFPFFFRGIAAALRASAMTVEFKKCGGGNFASAALVRLRVKINIKLFSG